MIGNSASLGDVCAAVATLGDDPPPRSPSRLFSPEEPLQLKFNQGRDDSCRAPGVGMHAYSTPVANHLIGTDDSPPNAVKDRVNIAEAKAAVKTLASHVNDLEKFATNTYTQADTAFFDVRGAIAELHNLFDTLATRVTMIESVIEPGAGKGAWVGLCCTAHVLACGSCDHVCARPACVQR